MSEISELSAAYAFAVDEGDGTAFAALFAPEGRLLAYRIGDGGTPSSVVAGTEELSGVPAGLAARYRATRHVVGQTRHTVAGDEASGRTYCTAHHLTGDADGDWNVTRFVRYDDRYVRRDGRWLIAERVAYVEWEQRAPVRLELMEEHA